MRGRAAARHAALAFVAHGLLAVGVLSFDRRPGGADIHGWDAVRLLRLIESPVLWAIDGVLRRPSWILPPEWFYPDFELAYTVNVAFAYVVIGGAFYAGVTAGASLLLGSRESRPAAQRPGPGISSAP